MSVIDFIFPVIVVYSLPLTCFLRDPKKRGKRRFSAEIRFASKINISFKMNILSSNSLANASSLNDINNLTVQVVRGVWR